MPMDPERLKRKRAAAPVEQRPETPADAKGPHLPAAELTPAPVAGEVASMEPGQLDPLSADLIDSIPDRPALPQKRAAAPVGEAEPAADAPPAASEPEPAPQPFRKSQRPGVLLAVGGAVAAALVGVMALGNRKAPAPAPLAGTTNNTAFTPAPTPTAAPVDPLLNRPGRVATLGGRNV